ncbi:MAG TPA: type VI secretion system accessory protein TagJ [Steroidobacteraceae bacterium]|nr:type VI secretion system accessory protein TagJ [Steroidobacteraceae bacterium]
MNTAEQKFRDGDLAGCLADLQTLVRQQPADGRLRVFLAQVMMVLGQWDRALNQLRVLAEMDPSTLPMARTYETAVHCELFRAEVFAGSRTPLVFGDPEPWVAQLIQSLGLVAQGHYEQALELRAQAFEAAPTTPGTLNDHPFEWIADADARFGPIFEAILNGKYYWVPAHRLASVVIEAPSDARDFVWMPAELTFANGGQAMALLPARYPGSESDADDAIRLSRKTEWRDLGPELHVGVGQRVIATDAEEIGLLEVRRIAFETPAE